MSGAEKLPNFFDLVDEMYRLNPIAYAEMSTLLWKAATVLQDHSERYGVAHGSETEGLDRQVCFVAAMLSAMSIENVLLTKHYAREHIQKQGRFKEFVAKDQDHNLHGLAAELGIKLNEKQEQLLSMARDMLTLGRYPAKKFKGGRKVKKTSLPADDHKLREYLKEAPIDL